MRMWLERIPEKDQYVDFALADLRSDLLISAQRPVLQTCDGKIKFSLKQVPCRAGRHEFVATQGLLIEFCPGQEILLFVVMRDDRYGFLLSHLHHFDLHRCPPLTDVFCLLFAVSQASVTSAFRRFIACITPARFS